MIFLRIFGALAFTIFIVVYADRTEDWKARFLMRRAKNKPEYAFFFEDLKEFKDTAIIYDDESYKKPGNCFFCNPFNEKTVKAYLAKCPDKLMPAELLNLFVLLLSVSSPDLVYSEREAFRKIACKHLLRFPKESWRIWYFYYENTIYRKDLELLLETGEAEWLYKAYNTNTKKDAIHIQPWM